MKTTGARRKLRYEKVRSMLLQGEVGVVAAGEELFNAGYELELAGRSHEADGVYRQTIELLESLSDRSDVKVTDIADLALNHGIKLFELGRFQAAQAAFQRSREVLDSLVILDASFALMIRLAQALGWLARAQRKAGQGIEAIRTYERVIALWRTLLKFPQQPVERERMDHQLATALFGLAKVYSSHGRRQKAERYAVEARDLLRGFLPGNN